ncbi:MAG TPA: DUF2889 domain-containing protein [Acidimicrobiales bacterium]|jgi:hypothetical protein
MSDPGTDVVGPADGTATSSRREMSEGGFTGELPGPVQAAAPARRPGSVRRTSNLDVTRRTGSSGSFSPVASIVGSARDLLTVGGPARAVVLGTARLGVTIDESGAISGVEQDPGDPSCAPLVGVRSGFGFRSSTKDLLTALDGSLLGLLVDDLSGAPAPSGYASIRERKLGGETVELPPPTPVALPTGGFDPSVLPPGFDLASLPAGVDLAALAAMAGRASTQTDVCAGWRAQGIPTRRRQEGRELPFDDEPPLAPSLVSDDDEAWHDMAELAPGQTRRIRRLDLTPDGDVLLADVMFRDSIVDPDGTPRVVHEYAVSATIDRSTLAIRTIHADPRALPFVTDCPLAADSAAFLVGETVHDLRRRVKQISRGPASCTHLNDLYRSMADIAVLADALDSVRS